MYLPQVVYNQNEYIIEFWPPAKCTFFTERNIFRAQFNMQWFCLVFNQKNATGFFYLGGWELTIFTERLYFRDGRVPSNEVLMILGNLSVYILCILVNVMKLVSHWITQFMGSQLHVVRAGSIIPQTRVTEGMLNVDDSHSNGSTKAQWHGHILCEIRFLQFLCCGLEWNILKQENKNQLLTLGLKNHRVW